MFDYDLPGEDWTDLPTEECYREDPGWETLELLSLSFATVFAGILLTLAIWG